MDLSERVKKQGVLFVYDLSDKRSGMLETFDPEKPLLELFKENKLLEGRDIWQLVHILFKSQDDRAFIPVTDLEYDVLKAARLHFTHLHKDQRYGLQLCPYLSLPFKGNSPYMLFRKE